LLAKNEACTQNYFSNMSFEQKSLATLAVHYNDYIYPIFSRFENIKHKNAIEVPELKTQKKSRML